MINQSRLLNLANLLLLTLAVMAQQASAQEVLVEGSYDGYTKATGIATQNFVIPSEDLESSFLHLKTGYALLMGNVTDGGQESMTLRIVYGDTNGWAFLGAAHDSEGTALAVRVIANTVEYGNGVKEEVSIDMTRDYLVRHLETGLNIRIDGKAGRIFVKLPAAYLSVFLKQLELTEAKVRTKMQSPAPAASKPKLGVGFAPVDIANMSFVGLTSPRGVFVARVDPNSLASKSGIKVGDVIFTVNSRPVPGTLTGLQEILSEISTGTAVDFSIWRANAETHLTVQF